MMNDSFRFSNFSAVLFDSVKAVAKHDRFLRLWRAFSATLPTFPPSAFTVIPE
jgi:hypothetical protein